MINDINIAQYLMIYHAQFLMFSDAQYQYSFFIIFIDQYIYS